MTNQQIINTLNKTIVTLSRFIESKSTPDNSREKAIETRDKLQADLERLTAQGRLMR